MGRQLSDPLRQAILKTIQRKSPVPIWVIGTSMGTISAAAAAIRDTEQQIAGVVLTSSILAYKVPGAVPTQKLSMIRVPTLVVDLIANWIIRPVE